MTDREIMQQALEAFEDLKKSVTRDGTVSENWDAYYEKEYYALEALRQALAQEQTKCPRCGEVNPAEIHTCSPQVAQPEQTMTPISPDQYETFCFTCGACTGKPWVGLHLDDIPETFVGDWSFLEGARWAGAKLKEKNGGS